MLRQTKEAKLSFLLLRSIVCTQDKSRRRQYYYTQTALTWNWCFTGNDDGLSHASPTLSYGMRIKDMQLMVAVQSGLALHEFMYIHESFIESRDSAENEKRICDTEICTK